MPTFKDGNIYDDDGKLVGHYKQLGVNTDNFMWMDPDPKAWEKLVHESKALKQKPIEIQCSYDPLPAVTFANFLKALSDWEQNPHGHTYVPATCNDVPPAVPTEINELGNKLAAKIVLADPTKKIRVPSQDEWHGVNALDRDGEL